MATEIYRKESQAYGEFNGGEIIENKPVGFPQDGGGLKPYSNIFYWANAATEVGSTIGLHPHQGFEIMSFVIEGDIEHYDTYYKEWRSLAKGSAQIIRSGNGISHSERLNKGAQMFQIWLDPNLKQSLQRPASYDDYKDSDFDVVEKNGIRSKIYMGDDAPMQKETPGVGISEMWIGKGEHMLDIDRESFYSLYLISGNAEINDEKVVADDFIRLSEEVKIIIDAKEESRLFIIRSPLHLQYPTYSQLHNK